MQARYHSGWNEAGYLPTELPACHVRWQDSADSLAELMKQVADEDDAAAVEAVNWDDYESEEAYWNSDDAPSMLAQAGAVLRDDPPQPEHDYEVTLENHELRHFAFWLRKVVCEDDDSIGPAEEDDEPLESNEAKYIRLAIERATETGEPITNEAARLIAGQVHGGQASSLYALASSGAIDLDGLYAEIGRDYNDPNTTGEVKLMEHFLIRYAEHHGERGPWEHWHMLTADDRIAHLLEIWDE